MPSIKTLFRTVMMKVLYNENIVVLVAELVDSGGF
jgi:hypothetical protein